jgi:hypothetical protein
VNQKALEIIAIDFGKGSQHDFSLFKDNRSRMPAHICTLADSGYQGILDWHSNSQMPAKKSKLYPLTKSKKREIAKYQKNAFCRKCHSQAENLSHFERTLSEPPKTFWTSLQLDCGHLQSRTQNDQQIDFCKRSIVRSTIDTI